MTPYAAVRGGWRQGGRKRALSRSAVQLPACGVPKYGARRAKRSAETPLSSPAAHRTERRFDQAIDRRPAVIQGATVRETSLFAPNEVHVGQDVGGRTFSITRDAIERYKNGTASLVDTQGFVPALVFHSEVYRNLGWYLPNLIGNLHARQEWELFHPLHAGQVVTSRTTVVDRYRKRNREYVVAEVVIADERGRWLQRSRTHQSFLAEDPGDAMVVDRDREKRSDRRFELPDGDGETIELSPRRITHAMC